MKKVVCFSLLFLSIITFALAQEKAKRPMTTDDGLNMIRVREALMSPDGQRVFYSQSELDWKDKSKRQKTTYYMVSAAGGEAFQYIGDAGGSSFQFSPDGKYFSFKRAVEKKQQLFLMRTKGGEAVQLTKHKSSIGSYKWSQDERTIFFVASKSKSKEEKKNTKTAMMQFLWMKVPTASKRGAGIICGNLISKKSKRPGSPKMILESAALMFPPMASGSYLPPVMKIAAISNTYPKYI